MLKEEFESIISDAKEIEFDLTPYVIENPKYNYTPSDRVANLTREQKVLIDRIVNWSVTRNALSKRRKVVFESGVESGNYSEEKMQNVSDAMGDVEYKVSAGSSSFPNVNQDAYLDLDDFFSRPVLLSSFPIDSGSVQTNFDVWDLYSKDPTVRAKLRNYAYFRGDMKIRVAISGCPFHYGRVLLSYQPYAEFNQPLNYLNASTLSFPGMRPLLINYLSQAEGAVTMDIKANKPVVVDIPFISVKPVFRLFNTTGSVIADTTSYDDFANAGKLYFMTINDVKSVSTGFTPVYVQIYAWMENVNLGTQTATQIQITTESGKESESKTGPIEKFASGAAEIANALTVVPYISPIAKASHIALSGLANIAALFGWSKPQVESEPVYVKNVGFQNGASGIGWDTTFKMSLDPQTELTVDPRICGTDEDSMTIAAIARRPTYLTTFGWSDSDQIMEPTWLCRVTPSLVTSDSTFRQPTAMAFAVAPFGYWRGSITYRFEVVASSFHRGKFLVFYEPNISQGTIINADLKLNRNYLAIVDIQELQDFEVTINWANPRTWAATDQYPYSNAFGTSIATVNPAQANGYIGVVPFTELQSPDTSGIEINVFVYCDDLVVSYPTTRTISSFKRAIRTESGVESSEGTTKLSMNPGSDGSEAEWCLGERVLSFRTLMKRYVSTRNSPVDISLVLNPQYYHLRIPDIYTTFGSSTTGIFDMFDYLRYAYVGLRGAVKHRYSLYDFDTKSSISRAIISNSNMSSSTTTGVIPADTLSRLEGSCVFVPTSNGGIEVEAPFFTNNLFQLSFSNNPSLATDEQVEYWPKKVLATFMGQSGLTANITHDVAAGEDFCLMRFQGAPYYST